MTLPTLIRPPRLWPAHAAQGRRVTWLELFFDLIFVAAVAQVGVPLTVDYDFSGLVRYAFLFVLIWWAWLGHTMYSTRFDSDDLVQRLLTLVQIFMAAVMAANAKDALDSRSSAGFGAAYAAMRIVLVVQYLRARRIAKSRALTNHYALGFGTAAFLWLISAIVPADLRFFFWAIALMIDIGTPLVSWQHSERFPPNAEHLPERFGLFTIILLGESVASVMRGIESQEYWSPPAATAAFTGLTLTFVLWWWYFDGVAGAAARHIRSKKEALMFQAWSFAHLPLYLAIGVAGVGVEHVISLGTGAHFHPSESWILCGAVALLMASMVTIGATAEAFQRRQTPIRHLLPRYGIAILALLVGPLGERVPPVFLVIALTLLAVVQAVFAIRDILAHQTGYSELLDQASAFGSKEIEA
jgi:low temperature requirement protein LtrA